MSDGYAKAKVAYQELRSAIGPWVRQNGYRRWAGAGAGQPRVDHPAPVGFFALPAYLKQDVAPDSLLGHELRSLYDPAPQYLEGHMVSFNYYSLRDVRGLAVFIAGMLPRALERFVGR